MNTQALESTAQQMVAYGKGLIAIDESIGTCDKRFAKWRYPAVPTYGAGLAARTSWFGCHKRWQQLIVSSKQL
jgi:hypothetical protein